MQKNKSIDKFLQNYHSFLTASKNHNLEQCFRSVNYLEEQEQVFWDNVLQFINEAKNEITEIKSLYTDNASYAQQLYEALSAKNYPVELKDNMLVLGPINIEIFIQNEYYILLSLGRKKLKIKDLEITKAIKSIEAFYKKINISFNANSFINKLVKAYEFANKAMYGSKDITFGNAVPLDDIFKIFTISPTGNDYKKENFIWDLGRLISQIPDNSKYQIELGFSRKIGNTMIIKDTEGNINNFSTLTIYKKEI